MQCVICIMMTIEGGQKDVSSLEGTKIKKYSLWLVYSYIIVKVFIIFCKKIWGVIKNVAFWAPTVVDGSKCQLSLTARKVQPLTLMVEVISQIEKMQIDIFIIKIKFLLLKP